MVAAERAPDAFEVALAALRRTERATAELGAWLATRGYESEEIEATSGRLTEVGELDDDRFARRRQPLDADAERARALGFLTRRGYQYEVAYEAIRLAASRAA